MNYSNFLNMPGGFGSGGIFTLIMLLALWEMVWKGFGLWKAARNNETGWFVAILIFNTVGILPIVYIYLIAKDKKNKS